MGKYIGNEVSMGTQEAVRTLLILHDFEKLLKACQSFCHIIPIKGVALLLTVYREDFARNISDIDVVIYPEERIGCLKDILYSEGYRLEQESAIKPNVLHYKHKCTFRAPGTAYADIDIHVKFITKKFFCKTCGSFSEDALKRCYNYTWNGMQIQLMNDIDHWLLLAQHACFHMFFGKKWIKDLYLLQASMSVQEIGELYVRAEQYGFCKVVNAAVYHLIEHYGCSAIKVKNFELYRTRRLLNFIIVHDRPFKRSVKDRFIAAYWEFVFIDRLSSQLRAFLALLFPSLGMMINIYKMGNRYVNILFYPIHVLFTMFCTVLFLLYFFILGWKIKVKAE